MGIRFRSIAGLNPHEAPRGGAADSQCPEAPAPAASWSFSLGAERGLGGAGRLLLRRPPAAPCFPHVGTLLEAEEDGVVKDAVSKGEPSAGTGLGGTEGLVALKDNPEKRKEEQQEAEGVRLPFVPGVMLGWLHTSTDRELFVDPPEEVEDPDEVLGPFPREFSLGGRELEEEFRRHRLAIVRLGRRKQPFFVSAEARTPPPYAASRRPSLHTPP